MAFRRKKTGEAGKEFEKKKGRLTTIVVVFFWLFISYPQKRTPIRKREKEKEVDSRAVCVIQ
jgi:hypothetical protein